MNKIIKKIADLTQAFFEDPFYLNHWNDSSMHHPRDRDRLSVRLPWEYRRKTDNYNSYYSRMFLEDLNLGIMPFLSIANNRTKYPVSICPHSTSKERLIAEGVWNRDYQPIADALWDFVEESAHIIFSEGEVLYEIVCKKNDRWETTSFSLELLENKYLFCFWKKYYQIIPWWVAKAWHIRAWINKIPSERVLKIGFPKKIASKNKIKNILARLTFLSKDLVIPDFQKKAMENNNSNYTGFDLEDFAKYKYLEVAQLTNNFWWNQRDYSSKYITEYYSITRLLRKKMIEASVREEVISKLNEAINDTLLDLKVTIIAENIFSIRDVAIQEEKLKNGSVEFTKLLEDLSIN